MLLALMPATVFAASGTEEDPIVLEVGETVSIPSGTDAYLTFTPPEDGVYTLEGLVRFMPAIPSRRMWKLYTRARFSTVGLPTVSR